MSDAAAARSWPHPLLIAIIVSIAPFAINGSVPLFGSIEREFGLEPGNASAISSVFALGYGIGHLLVAWLANRPLKKVVLLTCMGCFVLITLGCTLTNSFEILITLVFFQGLTASACPIIGRSIVNRGSDYERSAKLLSSASAIFSWVPVLAPLLAILLIECSGWRAMFFALALYSAVILAVVASKPSYVFDAWSGRPVSFATAGARLLTTKSFWAGLLVTSGAFAAFFTLIASSNRFAQDSELLIISAGWSTAIIAACFAVGNVISRMLLFIFSSVVAMWIAVCVAAILAVLSLFASICAIPFELVFFLACAIAITAGAAVPHSTMLAMRTAEDSSVIALAFIGGAKLILSSALTGLLAFASLSSSTAIFGVVLTATLVAVTGLMFASPTKMRDSFESA